MHIKYLISSITSLTQSGSKYGLESKPELSDLMNKVASLQSGKKSAFNLD